MKNFLYLFLTAVLLSSCGSDGDEPSIESYDSLQTFFTKEGVPTQSFTVNSSDNIQITSAKGNKVIFSPNAFVTYDNTPVSGPVNIELK